MEAAPIARELLPMGNIVDGQLMTGAPIARDLCATAHISNKATLEIAKVEPERRQEIFDKATEASSGHVPTARVIKQVHPPSLSPDR